MITIFFIFLLAYVSILFEESEVERVNKPYKKAKNGIII
jgi:hypothetical protein